MGIISSVGGGLQWKTADFGEEKTFEKKIDTINLSSSWSKWTGGGFMKEGTVKKHFGQAKSNLGNNPSRPTSLCYLS